MHIIVKAKSSDENYNGDCDYAVVELTVALAEEIRQRVAIARQAQTAVRRPLRIVFLGRQGGLL